MCLGLFPAHEGEQLFREHWIISFGSPSQRLGAVRSSEGAPPPLGDEPPARPTGFRTRRLSTTRERRSRAVGAPSRISAAKADFAGRSLAITKLPLVAALIDTRHGMASRYICCVLCIVLCPLIWTLPRQLQLRTCHRWKKCYQASTNGEIYRQTILAPLIEQLDTKTTPCCRKL